MRRPDVRLLAPALAAGAFLALAAAPADAAPGERAAFRPCAAGGPVLCARVPVPLDRSGAVPGRVRLLVARVRSRPRRRGVLLALAGGPGQAATPLLETFAEAAAPALRDHELVVFDQRGTGASGLLRCPSVERRFVRDLRAAGAMCAQRLGRARSLYTTRDSIHDVEAVRRALGVPRLSLLGVSYGTKVALGYATTYPERVERLVLDSAVAPEGPDVFSRSTFAAIPGVLRDVCRGRRCRGVTPDPVADLAGLAARLRTAPLRGIVVSPRGRRRPALLRTSGLLALVQATDVDPTLLAALPAAVRSTGRGDAAPILRLLRDAAAAHDPGPPREFSTALLLATLCEESRFPWQRTAAPVQRRHELGAALQALGDGPFAPFDRTAAIAAYAMPACYEWPAAPDAPDFPTAPAPAAPALLLAGSLDLRTPLQDARELAARLPDARVLEAVGSGHSVLGASGTSCPGRALRDFFTGRPVRRRCPRDRGSDLGPDPLAPLSLSEVAPVRGLAGRRGRTVNAALLTINDGVVSLLRPVFEELSKPTGARTVSAGGLRGGWISAGGRGIELHRTVYVPGVAVSGRLAPVEGSFAARLRISGRAAARGTLTITPEGAVTGRLGGRRVRVRAGVLDAAAGAAGPARPPAALARLRAAHARLRAGPRSVAPAPGPLAPALGPRRWRP